MMALCRAPYFGCRCLRKAETNSRFLNEKAYRAREQSQGTAMPVAANAALCVD